MAQRQKKGIGDWLSGLAPGVVVGLIVAVLGWNSENLGLKQGRIAGLEEAHERLLRENAALLVQNGLLKVQKEFGPRISESDALFKFINSIKRPGWCKEAVLTSSGDPSIEDLPADFPLVFGVVFPMRHVNPDYAQAYGKSYAFYVGRLDFAVYPRHIAERYHINDREVFTYKSFQVFSESVQYAGGQIAVEQFWKFHHALTDGTEYICGWQITWDRMPNSPMPKPARDRPDIWLPDKRRYGFWV